MATEGHFLKDMATEGRLLKGMATEGRFLKDMATEGRLLKGMATSQEPGHKNFCRAPGANRLCAQDTQTPPRCAQDTQTPPRCAQDTQTPPRCAQDTPPTTRGVYPQYNLFTGGLNLWQDAQRMLRTPISRYTTHVTTATTTTRSSISTFPTLTSTNSIPLGVMGTATQSEGFVNGRNSGPITTAHAGVGLQGLLAHLLDLNRHLNQEAVETRPTTFFNQPGRPSLEPTHVPTNPSTITRTNNNSRTITNNNSTITNNTSRGPASNHLQESIMDSVGIYEQDIYFRNRVHQTPRTSKPKPIVTGPCILCFTLTMKCSGCEYNICASCMIVHTCLHPDRAVEFCPAHPEFPRIGVCRDHAGSPVCRACCITYIGFHHTCHIQYKAENEADEEHSGIISGLVTRVVLDMEKRGIPTPIFLPIRNIRKIFHTRRPQEYPKVPSWFWTSYVTDINAFLFKYFTKIMPNIPEQTRALACLWLKISPLMPQPSFSCTFDTSSADTPDLAQCYIKKLGSCPEALIGIDGRLFVSIRNISGKPCKIRNQLVNVEVDRGIGHSTSRVAATMQVYGNNAIMVSFCFTQFLQHTINITVNGKDVPGSPMGVFVRPFHPFLPDRTGVVKDLHLSEKTNLVQPHGICTHTSGNFYITDYVTSKITILDQDLKYVSYIASRGCYPGELENPAGIAVDEEHNLVVCDSGNWRIQVFSPQGHVLRCSQRMNWRPYSVTVAMGNRYVVGSYEGDAYVITPDFYKISPLPLPSDTNSPYKCPCVVHTGILDDVFVIQNTPASLVSSCLGNGKISHFCGLDKLSNMMQVRMLDLIVDRQGLFVITEMYTQTVRVYTASGKEVAQWVCEGEPINVAEVPTMPGHYLVSLTSKEGGTGSLKLCGTVESED
ncbi:NHL repeat [Trinorchestia longiramus]|nr:NHL repeat [Trinorchestia longiramus]